MKEKKIIMDSREIEKTLKRLLSEILENNYNPNDICFIGIKSRGVPMTNRFSE